MDQLRTYWTRLPSEEKANTLTHLIPLLAVLVLAWPLTAKAGQCTVYPVPLTLAGTLLFLTGAVLMFLSSTLYHAAIDPDVKARLRIFDHISIYVMIAGSYSLICLSVVGGWIGWTLFIFLWLCVLAGAIGKFIALGRHPRLSLALYLAMGWVALLILYPMWLNMPHAAFLWIVAEGGFYTLGAYFFRKDEEHAYYHAIWHVFITLGAASHTLALWLILSSNGLNGAQTMCEQIVRRYPEATLQDVYKTCYQDFFGAEHLMQDTAAARTYLHYELDEMSNEQTANGMPMREPTGFRHRFERINLALVRNGEMTEEELLRLFINAAGTNNALHAHWADEWKQIEAIALRVHPAWQNEELQKALHEAAAGNHAVRHSEAFRNTYKPHYRIVQL